jgi:hypothetical protein
MAKLLSLYRSFLSFASSSLERGKKRKDEHGRERKRMLLKIFYATKVI